MRTIGRWLVLMLAVGWLGSASAAHLVITPGRVLCLQTDHDLSCEEQELRRLRAEVTKMKAELQMLLDSEGCAEG